MPSSCPLNNNGESITKNKANCVIRIKRSVAKYTSMRFVSGKQGKCLGIKMGAMH